MKRLLQGIFSGLIIGAVLVLTMMYVFENKKPSSPDAGIKLVDNDSTGKAEKKFYQQLIYGDEMDLDSSNYMLIPIGVKSLESSKLTNLSASRYDDMHGDSTYVAFKYNFISLHQNHFNNIIFYNKLTNQSHLLFTSAAIISKFYFPRITSVDYAGPKYWFILLGIRENDTNADGYISEYDAERMYMADMEGKHLIQVTPDNTQLVDWHIDKTTKNIIFKIMSDSNGDLKFNNLDEIDILRTAISRPFMGEPILNEPIKDSIRRILRNIKS